MKNFRFAFPLRTVTLLGVLSLSAFSDDRTLALILKKAQTDSKVMEHAFFLSDVYGPRFLASPASYQAADWVKKRLQEIGIGDVRLEGIGVVEEAGFRWSGRGWSYRLPQLVGTSVRQPQRDSGPLFAEHVGCRKRASHSD